MSDTINKQKKSQGQRSKVYYAAQFARTAKNKDRKKEACKADGIETPNET